MIKTLKNPDFVKKEKDSLVLLENHDYLPKKNDEAMERAKLWPQILLGTKWNDDQQSSNSGESKESSNICKLKKVEKKI